VLRDLGGNVGLGLVAAALSRIGSDSRSP
jgi:hypothetical protein